MTGISEFLTLQSVVPSLHARCKREALSALADRAAILTGISADVIRQALSDREQLGSTGVGRGVAVPHGKIEGLANIVGVLARMERPIDFDSVDEQPVDLIFVLLAPADATAAHLKALAKVSRFMRDETKREALRGAETAEALLAIATESVQSNAA